MIAGGETWFQPWRWREITRRSIKTAGEDQCRRTIKWSLAGEVGSSLVGEEDEMIVQWLAFFEPYLKMVRNYV